MKFKKLIRSTISLLLSVLMLSGAAVTAFAAETADPQSFTVSRISHLENGPREVDGLLDGGDRGTSYTWRLAERGDDVYIATYRNLMAGVIDLFEEALVPMGISADTVWALTDVITNGELPDAEDDDGAYIIKYNKTTGAFTKVFTFPQHMQCRMVVNFEGNIYAGSFSSHRDLRQYLYKIDENDSVTEVFSTSDSFSIRANCVFDNGDGDHLYFAGADERETLESGDENYVKVAVWEKDADDDTVWNRVADYKDFYDYASDAAMKNNTGCPVWELASHNGYIYAGMPYSKGYIIFRGRPAEDGEEANAYGWIWEEVVGEKNGINNPGMAPDAAGWNDGNFDTIVSVYEFNGELYCFGFDQTIMAELAFIQGALYKAAGQNVSLSDMIGPVYRTLHHTQKLYKLNDATGAFEECKGFTELMEGTCNEYVWRAGTYDGYMYVSTMDSAVIYNYITRLTNGSISELTPAESSEQLGYLARLMWILATSQSEGNEYISKLLDYVSKLRDMLKEAEDFRVDQNAVIDYLKEYAGLDDALDQIIAQIAEKITGEVLDETTSDLPETVPMSGDELASLIEDSARDMLSVFSAGEIAEADVQETVALAKEAVADQIPADAETGLFDVPVVEVIGAVYDAVAKVMKEVGADEALALTAEKLEALSVSASNAVVNVLSSYLGTDAEKNAAVQQIAKSILNNIYKANGIDPKNPGEGPFDISFDSVLKATESALDAYISSAMVVARMQYKVLSAKISEKLETLFSEIPVSKEVLTDLIAEELEKLVPGAENGSEVTVDEIAKAVENVIREKLSGVIANLKDAYDSVDWDGLEMYRWVSDAVKNDEWGFDIVRTRNGVDFEVVTRDGFGDKYNYGCAAFLAAEEGLYIGTCNPFYGGQLYLLTTENAGPEDPTDPEKDPDDVPRDFIWGDVDGDGKVTITDATLIQRHLADITVLTEEQQRRGMVTNGKKLTITDATQIQRYLADMILKFPVEEAETT